MNRAMSQGQLQSQHMINQPPKGFVPNPNQPPPGMQGAGVKRPGPPGNPPPGATKSGNVPFRPNQ
jgi:hypothetical protein